MCLAWHDGGAWLILWQGQLPKATARPRGQEPNVVSDLHDGASKHIEGTRYLNHGVVSCQGFKFIGCGDER